jgi:hypothetical protein
MEEQEERKTVSFDDIQRLYDVVAVGVVVTMEAEAQGKELDVERLTGEAEGRLEKMGSAEWYSEEWREKLVETIQERIAEIKAEHEA